MSTEDQNISGAVPGAQTPNPNTLVTNPNANPWEVFNPNAALSALQTFNTLNNVTNKMFGIDARWFRAVPQQRSKDIMFKEYTLSCVEETPLCLRVVVANGTMPDSNYQYDLMGLEYNVPVEIQIDKKYWEEIAGFGTAPQKKDIVYLAMPNKLYQVESSYLKRGFMEQETTWVCNLRKYTPEASRREGDALKETIDKYTISEQELFGDAQEYERMKLTDKRQMSPFNSTERDQFKELDDNLRVIPTNVEIYGTIVAQGFYDMASSSMYNAVEYKSPVGDEIKPTYDRAITAWINPQPVDESYEVVWIQEDLTLTPPANYKIKIKGPRRFAVDDVFVISKSGSLNFYAKVIDDGYSSTGVYWCRIESSVVSHMNSVKPNWSSQLGYKAKLKNPITLLDGINTSTSGFAVTIAANQYVKIQYGTQEHMAILDTQLTDNTWYGVVVNIGNSWNQYNVYVWEQHPSDLDAKIRVKFYSTIPFTPEYTTVQKYTVNKSPSYVTNIRLFKTTIEEENQPKELLSYFTKDSDQALILDSCDIRFRAPYISKQR